MYTLVVLFSMFWQTPFINPVDGIMSSVVVPGFASEELCLKEGAKVGLEKPDPHMKVKIVCLKTK